MLSTFSYAYEPFVCLSFLCLFCFVFLGLHLQHMHVPKLGVESELKLPAYTTATAPWDPGCVCSLCHSSRQCQILNPLSGARDQTCILMDTSWVHYRWATVGPPSLLFSNRASVRLISPTQGKCEHPFSLGESWLYWLFQFPLNNWL